jgi:DNA polymerase III alpha subunit
MGLMVLPPDINASDFRCIGTGQEIRIGLQFVKGLSTDAVERVLSQRGSRPFTSIFDLRTRTGIAPSDLRLLIKVGALDSIAHEWTRPMMLWLVDSAGQRDCGPDWFDHLPPAVPILREYTADRRRREEYDILGFMTDAHPMQLHAEQLQRLRICPSTRLDQHVGQNVLAAGMLTTAKPVYTKAEEPMEFATFDDGHGLIEAVLFPGLYRDRGHVLFDQGPFIFRGLVEEEFGAVTMTLTHLDRLDRVRDRLRR